MKSCIIIGGSGFVGRHLVDHLLVKNLYSRIIIGDLVPPSDPPAAPVIYIQTDVRRPIDPKPYADVLDGQEAVIYNLAAISRIPGYPDKDYYETNIWGAEQVCALAEAVGCETIVFTSTIATYGSSKDLKVEDAIPMPDNPYGTSKVIAEHIHRSWLVSQPGRNLHILRPGIIFGKGEGANFTRLYKAISKGIFFYPGRRNTLKASVYVKDVAEVCVQLAEVKTGLNIFNLCYPVPPTIEEICQSMAEVIGKRPPRITVPAGLLLLAAGVITFVLRLLGNRNPSFHPDRVRKLMYSTNISGRALKEAGINLQYTIPEAIEDWYHDNERTGLL